MGALLCLSGCRPPGPADPTAQFEKIHNDFLRGHLPAAEQAAAHEREAWLPRDARWSFRFCLLEAEILSIEGRSSKVVETLQQGDRTFTPDDDLAIKQSLLLSLSFARMGDSKAAAVEFSNARRRALQSNSPLVGELLQTRGILEIRSGDKPAAEASFRSSLDFARQHGDVFLEASNLLNLGFAALQAEHIDEALDRFNASSQLAATIHADTISQAALGNAGWAYYSLGDFERALSSFRRAESQAGLLGAKDNEILWLQSSGLSLYRLGAFKDAQTCYEQALEAAQSNQDKARLVSANTSLGQLFLQLNQLDAARARAAEALTTARQIGDKSSELEAGLLQGLIAARTSSGPETEKIFQAIYSEASKLPSLRWETENALANLYAARHQNQPAALWHRRSIATFEAQRASVADEERRLPFFANGDALYRDYADFLIASNHPDDALHLLDSARAKTLKEGLGEQTAASRTRLLPQQDAEIARRLNAVILFYSLGPGRSLLWAIDRRGAHMFVLPGESEIAPRVRAFQAAILKSRDPQQESNLDGQWLYNALVSPAESLIPKDSRVILIPGGSLNSFNMETLLKPGPQGLHYWIEDVSISTATSVQLLSRLESESPTAASGPRPGQLAAGKLLLIGDPIYTAGAYPPLSNASAEVQSVQQYFPAEARTTLTQGAAVPAAYAENRPEEYAYIHFVAHGIASSLRPLDSAIVLSPSSTDRDNFKLYARDVVRRPLHARLVTISACYGSGISNYADEGLVGLSWAFLRAGAHQVIGAMWEVNDSSTPQLMDKLYRDLASGAEPDRALRNAKLSLLHSPGVFRKPLYWGAFQLYAGS